MKRIRNLGVTLTLASLVVGGLLASTASAAPTGPATIFNSIPKTLPGNVTSVGFEATSTSEFGDYATFVGSKRRLQKVSVVMSSWGCQDGTWNAGTCSTTPGATFSHDVTLTLYTNPGAGAVGTVLATATQTFAIPYRPSADADCTGGRWQAASGTCYNGLATVITFNFSGVTLPNSVIYGISYNTTHYGDAPIGESAGCFGESGGCGYDALNVSAASTTPLKGTDDDVNGIFQDSDWTGAYCDNGTSGTGTFRLDTSCWTSFNPMVRFAARR